jgi:hypothetical protein
MNVGLLLGAAEGDLVGIAVVGVDEGLAVGPAVGSVGTGVGIALGR